jgi:hypothetical protein
MLALCLVISGIVHCSMVPFQLPRAIEVNDLEGEAVIPVDVLEGFDMPPPPPPEPSPPSQPAEDQKEKELAAAKAHVETSPRDAGAGDAAADAPRDAPSDTQAGFDGALVADNADAGEAGLRDPEEIIGAGSADTGLVRLVVNTHVIRSHPVGAHLGYLLRAIPQWEEFMSGTDVDPVRDWDWLMIYGPSIRNTSRDSLFIHYSVPDAMVDHNIQVIASRYARGGPFDAGVRGVKASLMQADRAERVILRPQPHLLAVVPPSVAQKNARLLVAHRLAEPHPGEALNLQLSDPHHALPDFFPESISKLRMRVLPIPDGGADVFMDGETKDADAASEAAVALRRTVRRYNDAFLSIVTHGLLDRVDVGTEGTVVKVHLTVTRDQIETLVTLVGDFLGVQPGAPPTASTTTPYSAPVPRAPSPAPKQPR